MKRIEIAEAHAGDIVGLAGFEARIHRGNDL